MGGRNMKTYKQLKKEQEQLNKELLKCPCCGIICKWEELIEGTECGMCWYGKRNAEYEKRKVGKIV